MPERFRLFLPFLAAGVLAGCTATTPDAPPGATTDTAANTAASEAPDAATGADEGRPSEAAANTAISGVSSSSQKLDKNATSPDGSSSGVRQSRRAMDPQDRQLRIQILRQLQPCLQDSAPEIANLQTLGPVAVFFAFDPDGQLIGAQLPKENEDRYNNEDDYRAVVNSMVRGVEACSPLTDMPLDRHEEWGIFPLVVQPRNT